MPEWPYISEAQDLPDGPPNAYHEPERIAAGDTITWKRSICLYPASQGWVLQYSLRGVPGSALDFQSTPFNDDHQVTLSTAQTGPLVPGRYRMAGYAVGNGERHCIFDGLLWVETNIQAAPADQDLRSHAEIVVSNIEAVLEGRATNDILESEIEGTKLSRIPVRDLLLLRDRYLAEILNLKRIALAKNGRATGRSVFARFTPVGR